MFMIGNPKTYIVASPRLQLVGTQTHIHGVNITSIKVLDLVCCQGRWRQLLWPLWSGAGLLLAGQFSLSCDLASRLSLLDASLGSTSAQPWWHSVDTTTTTVRYHLRFLAITMAIKHHFISIQS